MHLVAPVTAVVTEEADWNTSGITKSLVIVRFASGWLCSQHTAPIGQSINSLINQSVILYRQSESEALSGRLQCTNLAVLISSSASESTYM